MGRRSWILLLTLASIWGASYLLIKIGLRDFSPGMVAWLRIAFGALVLVPLALARDALRPAAAAGLGIIVGLAAVQVAGPFLLIALGEQEISSSLAGILVTSAPLFTALLAIRLDPEERSTGLRLVGVLAGFAGVIVLLGVDLSGSRAALLGGLAVVLAGLGYAVGGFIAKRRLSHVPPLGVAASVMVASTVLMAPVALAGLPGSAPGAGPVAAVIGLGTVGTGVAFAIFYDLIATVGPARAFVVTYIAPGFAVVYGAVLLDERITPAVVIGLALIVGGSWLAAGGRAGKAPQAQPPAPAEAPGALSGP